MVNHTILGLEIYGFGEKITKIFIKFLDFQFLSLLKLHSGHPFCGQYANCAFGG